MELDVVEKQAIAALFQTSFQELQDLFQQGGSSGLTKEFVKNALCMTDEQVEMRGFTAKGSNLNLIIVALSENEKFAYCVIGKNANLFPMRLEIPITPALFSS